MCVLLKNKVRSDQFQEMLDYAESNKVAILRYDLAIVGVKSKGTSGKVLKDSKPEAKNSKTKTYRD